MTDALQFDDVRVRNELAVHVVPTTLLAEDAHEPHR
jgi:hypothetical protein